MSRTFLRDERGQVELLLFLLLLLVFFGPILVLGGALAAIVLLGPVALFLYVWRVIFPFLRSIAEWLTSRVNCLPFFLFMLIILNITGGLLALWIILLPGRPWVILLILLLVPIFSIALFIFNTALGLVLIRGLVALNRHLYIGFRTRFLTIAFRIVMWRARRRQEREEKEVRRPKRRPRRRLRRRKKKEQSKDTGENSGQPGL